MQHLGSDPSGKQSAQFAGGSVVRNHRIARRAGQALPGKLAYLSVARQCDDFKALRMTCHDIQRTDADRSGRAEYGQFPHQDGVPANR